MSAFLTLVARPTTTTSVLAETASAPLHLWRDRDRLALQPVSSKSLWGSARWTLDDATPGARNSQSTVVWDLDLPDGSNLLDEENADLLDWLRRLIWSIFAAPGDGAGVLKPGSLGTISAGVRYWLAWLVDQGIRWPKEIDTQVVEAYLDHLQTETDDDDIPVLTVAAAYKRLAPFLYLWRQRFALEKAGISPMPAPPFGRHGVIKFAKKIAAVASGSYRPLPDEVAIPVLNTAMAMLGTPATDVIALSEACIAAHASGLAENTSLTNSSDLANERRLGAAAAFRFSEVNGRPWHAPLDPAEWEAATIASVEWKLQGYLKALQAKREAQTEVRDEAADLARLPTLRIKGATHVDLRRVVLDLGLSPGDEQLLCRHPQLQGLINAAALEQGLPRVPFNTILQRVRQLMIMIRSACHIIIQATTGMRISEICGLKAGIDPETGLPRSVTVQDGLAGLTEIFIVTSDLAKTEAETPRSVPWVLGYRPKGSADLPPAVQAILILERLLAPWRTLLGTDALFVSSRARSGLPISRDGVGRITADTLREDLKEFIGEWVDLAALPDDAVRKTMDNELVPYRESNGRIIKPHQLRKSFGYFASNIDRRLLPMLQMNFHHVSAAMTDGAYTGNPIIERDINDVRYQNSVFETLETARGSRGLAGRYGERLERKIIAELGPRIEGLSTEEAYLEAFVYVEEAAIDRMFFAPYGDCGANSVGASSMACHEVAGTVDLARWSHRLTPNWGTRRPGLCAGCACFAISRRHRPYWEQRYIDNAAMLKVFEELGHAGPMVDGTIKRTVADADQALKVCIKLAADREDLERRVAAQVEETLNAT